MENVIVQVDGKNYPIPYGTHTLGNNRYTVNSMGIFRVNNFECTKIYGGVVLDTNSQLVVDIELRGLYRTITK
jgi:hypothetical protein